MKGGGLVVVVFIIVFIFLFVCALWGISAIVGGIGRAFLSRHERPGSGIRLRAGRAVLLQDREPLPPSTTATSQAINEDVEKDVMAGTLSQLQQASELHRNGVLTDEELAYIKTILIKRI